jgi:hypothetical protein
MKIGAAAFADLNNRTLYYEYRRRLNPQTVLDYYGAENCQEQRNRHDGSIEVIHSCLIDRVEPHHAHGDASPSAAMNMEHKLYTCYAYWGGSLFALIQKLEGKKDFAGIIPILGQFLDGSTKAADTFKADLEKLFVKDPGTYSIEVPAYNERILRPWAFIHPYLGSRGITDAVAEELQIGWDERTNRITIPQWWEGNLVGWQMRAIPEGPDWPATAVPDPKYKNNPGFPKSDTLYCYDRAKARGDDHIIVVESPFSVLKAYSLGMANVVATFGAKVSSTQIALLRDFRRVTVWYDDDPAGWGAERKLVKGLWRHVKVDVVVPDKDKDLGDYDDIFDVERKLAGAEPAPFAMARYELQERRRRA